MSSISSSELAMSLQPCVCVMLPSVLLLTFANDSFSRANKPTSEEAPRSSLYTLCLGVGLTKRIRGLPRLRGAYGIPTIAHRTRGRPTTTDNSVQVWTSYVQPSANRVCSYTSDIQSVEVSSHPRPHWVILPPIICTRSAP